VCECIVHARILPIFYCPCYTAHIILRTLHCPYYTAHIILPILYCPYHTAHIILPIPSLACRLTTCISVGCFRGLVAAAAAPRVPDHPCRWLRCVLYSDDPLPSGSEVLTGKGGGDGQL
jgi:hypothetical protein